jgi:hypothetical protein
VYLLPYRISGYHLILKLNNILWQGRGVVDVSGLSESHWQVESDRLGH